MPHLWRLMYSDEVTNIKCKFNDKQPIAAIVTGLLRKRINQLGARETEHLPIAEERCFWWNFFSRAKQMISQEQAWKLIIEPSSF